jgi:hypothetical protein
MKLILISCVDTVYSRISLKIMYCMSSRNKNGLLYKCLYAFGRDYNLCWWIQYVSSDYKTFVNKHIYYVL